MKLDTLPYDEFGKHFLVNVISKDSVFPKHKKYEIFVIKYILQWIRTIDNFPI